MIVIMGFHRSGTSLMGSLVESAGYKIENTLKPNNLNPKGFWESIAVIAENGRLLQQAGGDWDNPPEREKIEKLKANKEVLNGAEAVKNPRFCLTFPCWDFKNAKVIKMIRNKYDACQSLAKGMGMTIERCLFLYSLYEERMNEYIKDNEKIEVNFEDLIQKKVSELVEFIGNVDTAPIDPTMVHIGRK